MSKGTAYEGLLQALRVAGCSSSDRGRTWTCPAHDDKRASLSVDYSDGKVLVHCHAGCHTADVLEAVGWHLSKLFDDPAGNPDREHPLATYVYRDEQGREVFEVRRLCGKKFQQARIEADGRRVTGRGCMKGVIRVPYRLPELLQAISGSAERIYITEGEKDVERLRAEGLTATCNPGGAGKWRDDFSDYFRGYVGEVLVVADRDPAGRKHAIQVTASLRRAGISARIVEAAAGKDASDHFDAGSGPDEFLPVDGEQLEEEPGPIRPARPGADYYIERGSIYRWKRTRDGDVPDLLARFAAEVVSFEQRDDGSGEVRGSYRIRGCLPEGESLPEIGVTASQFASMGWIASWGPRARIAPGQAKKDYLRDAIQALSDAVDERIVYEHTGWRVVDAERVYLHGGGALGAEGIGVDLPSALEPCLLPEANESAEAISASLRLLESAPLRITAPLHAAVYRAVLGGADFSLALTGPTGAGKSEIGALAQQHFGAGFDARHLPASWTSTGNSLEGLAFLAKDMLLVIDDFCPRGTRHDQQRLNKDADRVLRAVGNHSARARMGADGSLRPVKPPRCLVLSTGEDVPTGASLRARMVVIEIGPDDVDWDVMTDLQGLGAQGVLAAATSLFITWAAPQLDQLRADLDAGVQRWRAQSLSHRRTADALGHLSAAHAIWRRFAVEMGVLTAAEADLRGSQVDAALLEVGRTQAALQGDEDPVRRFAELLQGAIVAGEAHVASADAVGDEDAPPHDPVRWGWSVRWERGEDDGVRQQVAHGRKIGWLRDSDLHLHPDAAYKVAQQFASGQGVELGVTQQTLWKRMDERGLLRSKDKDRFTTKPTICGSRQRVIHVPAGLLVEVTGASGANGAADAEEGGEVPTPPVSGPDRPGRGSHPGQLCGAPEPAEAAAAPDRRPGCDPDAGQNPVLAGPARPAAAATAEPAPDAPGAPLSERERAAGAAGVADLAEEQERAFTGSNDDLARETGL